MAMVTTGEGQLAMSSGSINELWGGVPQCTASRVGLVLPGNTQSPLLSGRSTDTELCFYRNTQIYKSACCRVCLLLPCTSTIWSTSTCVEVKPNYQIIVANGTRNQMSLVKRNVLVYCTQWCLLTWGIRASHGELICQVCEKKQNERVIHMCVSCEAETGQLTTSMLLRPKSLTNADACLWKTCLGFTYGGMFI